MVSPTKLMSGLIPSSTLVKRHFCYQLNGFAKLEQIDQTGIGMMTSWVTEART